METTENREAKLDAMPDVVMEEILKGCSYVDIQSLRKTCRYIRNIVDDIKPVSPVTWIELLLGDAIHGKIHFKDGPVLDVTYRGFHEICSVSNNTSRTARDFENTSVASVFRHDFKILLASLNQQKKPIERLELFLAVNGPALLQQTIIELLQENRKLQVERLKLRCDDAASVLMALSVVSEDVLEKLLIQRNGYEDEMPILGAALDMEHWNNLKGLRIMDYLVGNVKSFVSVPDLEVNCATISPEDVVLLKESYRISSTFDRCLIFLDNIDNRLEILRAILPPNVEAGFRNLHFATTTPGQMLTIEFSLRYLSFRISDISNQIEVYG